MILAGGATDRLPEAGAGFVWKALRDSVPFLRPMTDGVVAAFTTRRGGTSPPPFDELNLSFRVGDEDANTRANRRVAGEAIGRDGRWSVVRQVHGCDVVRTEPPGSLPTADAHWTDDPGQTLAVLGADCVPVLVVGDRRVGVAHAGWRGLVAGVIANAVRAVGGAPAVFAGPAIGPCCYGVGPEVTEVFASRFGASVVHDGHVDLWAAVASAAEGAGVREFYTAGVCTSCHRELFFSHRRDTGRTGRQALLARLNDG